MIRKMQTADIDRIAEIWLDTNLKAHDFYTVGILEGKLWRCKRNDFSGRSVCIYR